MDENDENKLNEDASLASVAVGRVDHRPDVCGGEACIANTRIPVWLLVFARRMGADKSRLLRDYPPLREKDLEAAWAYAAEHPEEIENASWPCAEGKPCG